MKYHEVPMKYWRSPSAVRLKYLYPEGGPREDQISGVRTTFVLN